MDIRDKKGKCHTIEVPKSEAEDVRLLIKRSGLLDPSRSIGKDKERVYIPVRVQSKKDRLSILDIVNQYPKSLLTKNMDQTPERSRGKNPYQKIVEMLESTMNREEIGSLPDRWDMVGDCLILKSKDIKTMKRASEAYMEVLGARYVLLDRKGVSGELRNPQYDVINPPEDGEWVTEHREGGIVYRLDPRRIMFSSGNVGERTKTVSYPEIYPVLPAGTEGEVALDMFAGIGYFSLPLARSDKVAKVIACEKNPVAYRFLLENAVNNELGGRILGILGDNRVCLPERIADRIIMGYVGSTRDYISLALKMLREDSGVIHLHDTVPMEVGVSGLYSAIRGICGKSGWESKLMDGYRIKWYAPRIEHVVLHLSVNR